jgi:hypothetical protein
MGQSNPERWDWYGMGEANLSRGRIDQLSPEEMATVLERVDSRVHRMVLMVEAMRELLQASGLFSEAQLKAKVEEVDLRDGKADGRNVQPVAQVCGQCGRTSAGQRKFCVYCGSDLLRLVADNL